MDVKQIPVRTDFSENIEYNFPQFPIRIVNASLSSYPGYRTIPHWHEEIEFIYVLSGKMFYEVNGTSLILHEEEGIIVNSRNFHYDYAIEQKDCEFICVLIHPSLFAASSYIKEHFVLPFTECSTLPYIHLLQEDWHKEIGTMLHQLVSLDVKDEEFFLVSQKISAELFHCMYTNTREILKKEQNTSNKTLGSLRDMVHYIQNHYSEPITVKDITDAGNVGKTTCTAAFNTYMHTTPIEYLLTYRMSQSVNLLMETEKSITEIAYAVGFRDSSYFTKYFREYYGKTPREMRKEREKVK